ncbi:MAG: S1/P1 nuclease [Candidatus Accumulibacter sp.]|uniref:S1/P1 nuclease n=1 Tax=Accumulibacter sp. TaxID=2053492 RepID=UPI001A56C100|nr:S1/P1 nuclease [Accumulibacter sp.]MBL8395696.1 S1/P1 nuclease [Accumulibacter sp.]
MTARKRPSSSKMGQYVLLLAATLLCTSPAAAWNAAGHRISALIAWQRLDPGSRAAITALLRQHPDFARWQARGKGAEPGLATFLEASTWPDDIRRDQRFYSAGNEEPTPTLPGFPDMERRLEWHYIDRPLDMLPTTRAPAGELDRRLNMLVSTLANQGVQPSERAYALPWLIHLVGDAHQPLHAASRHTADGESDNGGNALLITNPFNMRHPSMSLHRYWDDLPGPPWLRDDRLAGTVSALTERHPPTGGSSTPALWIEESWLIARRYAYPESEDKPPTISPSFHERSQEIANHRITQAGYRLAELLRALFRPAQSAGRKPAGAPGESLRPAMFHVKQQCPNANAEPWRASGRRAVQSVGGC